VRSIQDDNNYFDAAVENDTFYYSAYETYKAQIAQNTINASAYKNYGYTDEQIEAEIKKNQAKLAEIYYTAIQNAETGIAECNQQISDINAQLSALASGQKN